MGSFRGYANEVWQNPSAFINPNDPLVRFQGGPADWTTDPATANWYKNSFNVSDWSRWRLIGNINKSSSRRVTAPILPAACLIIW